MSTAGYTLPFAALEPFVLAAIKERCNNERERGVTALGWDDTQAQRWLVARRRGYVTVYAADQIAVALGLHPWQIWGEAWWWPYLSGLTSLDERAAL